MAKTERYWVLGDVYTFLQAEPALSIIEVASALGHGPPPHLHQKEEEYFYVLEGELALHLGDERRTLRAGDFAHAPRGILHSYKTASPGGARHLTTIAPGGFEKLFRSIGTPYHGEEADPADQKSAIKKLLELAPDYGLVVPGPRSDASSERV